MESFSNRSRFIARIRLASFTRKPFRTLLLAFVLLCMIYAWATPPLEASDELWHFGLVNHIADTGELPVQDAETLTDWRQEGSQPPLYYWVTAALVQPLDRSDFRAAIQPNPHAIAGVPGAVGNKNLVLHPTPAHTALAVYVARLFSILCGVVTVWSVYACGRLLAPERPSVALLAAGLTAFNPMFLFITASVNNDNLVIALGSLAVWQMLVLLRDGFSWQRSVALALLIALAALTKLSGLVLVPVVALAALWVAYRQRDWRGLVLLGVLIAGVWALLAGWWYLRNLNLYGELFGTATMAAVAGERTGGFGLQTLLDEFQGFRFSYWGVFGAVNLMTFRPFYDLMDAVTMAALIGVVLHLWRTRTREDRAKARAREDRVRVLLLGLLVLIGSISVAVWTSQTYASQGRLLFPFVAAISPLLALGLGELIRWCRAQLAGIAVFGAFALVVPFASIAPAYTPPPAISEVPAEAKPVFARFGDAALIAYEAPDARYAPGDSVPVTVYWQVLQNSSANLSLYLHAVLDDGTTIGKVDSYPGGGTLQTRLWSPAPIYADHYEVPLTDSGEPSRLRIQVGWWNYATGEIVSATDTTGQPIPSVMLDVGGFAHTQTAETLDGAEPVSAAFGGVIRLVGYRLDGDTLALLWETIATPAEDYTVFVQALAGDNRIAAQGDAAPTLPTRYWRAGERFVTRHTLTPSQTDAEAAKIVVGWYRPDDFTRLDTDAPDDAFVLPERSPAP